MAGTRYGTKLLGTVFYGGDVIGEFVSKNFTASPNGYGRAFVRWSRPGGAWFEQRLLRNLVGVPVDELDGEVLLDQPTAIASTEYQDEGLAQGRHYYYALFVRDLNTQEWLRTGSADLLVTREYGYTRRLYDRVPDVFKSTDYSSVADARLEEELSFLYRFLELFGLQLDHVRTELEGLREANNPRLVSSRLLPALARQVGVEYEPELGDRAVRRYAANATRLYATKGTLAGVREVATTFTGWDTTVRIGTNLALDRLDAGPDGGVGRWTGRTNATTSYLAFTDADRGPSAVGGAVVVRATAAGTAVVDTNRAGSSKPLERLQYAVPVIPNLPYVASQYVRTTSTGVTARAGMQWLDVNGQPVGASSYGPAVPVSNDWSARAAHTRVAPATARYLEYSLQVDGLVSGGTARACALTVQERSTVADWAPSREVLIYLRGDLTNYVGNVSGHGLSAEGWSEGASSQDERDGSYYLAFSTDLATADETLALLDALSVTVPGDVSSDAPPVTYAQVSDTLVPGNYSQRLFTYPTYADAGRADITGADVEYISRYDAGIRDVEQGQVWSVLVDAGGRVGSFERDVEVGFALYDGTDLVGYDWSTPQQVAAEWERVTHELTVPDNAPYDGVAFAIRSRSPIMAWRNAALESVQLLDARQFDGSTASATSDYRWHGVPYRSASSYYSRRIVKTLRLRELLEEFLPHPASYRLVFSPDVVPDSPRASAGSDLDPDDQQTTTVGARARSRWNVTGRPGAQVGFRWAIESIQVANDLTSLWNLEQLNDQQAASWHVTELVGRDATPLWTTTASALRELDARWDVTVPAALELSMQWAVEQSASMWLNSQWNVNGNPVANDVVVAWETEERVELQDGFTVSATPTYQQADTGGAYTARTDGTTYGPSER